MKTSSSRREYRLTAVLGSLRQTSYTRFALNIALADVVRRRNVTIDLIDPGALALAWPGGEGSGALQAELVPRIQAADGVILATPEYHGSYSSVVKGLIDAMGYPSALADKPVALLGVAAGRLGAVKALEHLRSVCSHVGAIVLPYPISVAEVHKVFTAEGACTDKGLCAQLSALGEQLVDYLEGHYHLRVSMEELVREGE